jgi:NhaP-type Na+/H+ or K+/H+ antiporter
MGAIVSALSARVRFPAVLPLLAAGVVAGPSVLGLVDVESIGGAFRSLVALSIGLLVFEGGLHLDRKELGRAPRAVLGLLTIGALVTWLGATALGMLILGLDLPIALVLGSLLIVTGPTVIQPILRHIRLTPNLHAALSAEAILIDPIGVVLSVVTMEVVLVYYSGAFTGAWSHMLHGIVMPVGGGLIVGVAAGGIGFLAMRLLTGAKAPRSHAGLLNVAATGICMLSIAAGEMVAPEGGLVAATIAAVILANTRAIASSDVRQFKEQVATLLVGMLFILLASQIDLARLAGVGPTHFAFVAALLLVVRPLNTLFGSMRSTLGTRERVYIGLFAPRGIVAASVATLAVARIVEGLNAVPGGPDPSLLAQVQQLDLVVYLVIGVSVLMATTTALPLGRMLGVLAGPPRGVMIVGAHRLGRETARALASAGVPVVFVDLNLRNCDLALRDGLTVVRADATDPERMTELARVHETGWVFAWTGNDDVDKVVGRWAQGVIGPGLAGVGLPDLPSGTLSEDRSTTSPRLRTLERLLHEGRVVVEVSQQATEGVQLLTLNDGRPAKAEPSGGAGRKGVAWLVLRKVEPAALSVESSQAVVS